MSAINILCYEELSMLSQLVFLKYTILCFENAVIACRLSTFHAMNSLSTLSQLVFLKYTMLRPEFVLLHFSIEALVINSYFKKRHLNLKQKPMPNSRLIS